jgi:nicotinate phosphoribosyltransferase
MVRRMLDDAGLTECGIVVSNSLDERIIAEILRQGAVVDAFGVGERLITSASSPVFGAVYKLAATVEDGVSVPKIKVSENAAKITNPGEKALYRLYSEEGKAEADFITLADETFDWNEPLELFDPEYTWKRKTLTGYTARRMHVPVFRGGECVYEFPPLSAVREYCRRELDSMWSEVLRFENPHNYYVDLSVKLWDLKQKMIRAYRG